MGDDAYDEGEGVHVHFHLPDSIKNMSPEQLAALTGAASGGAAAAAAEPEPASVGDAGAVDGAVVLSAEEVARHADRDDCWVIVGGEVFDVTEFLDRHPGGRAILFGFAGQDATTMFDALHDPEILTDVAAPYRLGSLGETYDPSQPAESEGAVDGHVPAVDPKEQFGEDFPKAMRWLAARWEPEPTLPVSLRPLSSTPGHTGGTGMFPLEPRLWLEHDSSPHQRLPGVSRFAGELSIKRRLLERGPHNPHYDTVFQATPDSAPEQEELLQTVLDNLRAHHPDEYIFGEDSVTVVETGDTYRISDYSGQVDENGTPIAMQLASLLVQEVSLSLPAAWRVFPAAKSQCPHLLSTRSSLCCGGRGRCRSLKPTAYRRTSTCSSRAPPRSTWSSQGSRARGTSSGWARRCTPSTHASRCRHSAGCFLNRTAPTADRRVGRLRRQGMKEQGWHPKLAHVFSGVTAEQAFWRSNWSVIEHNLNTHYIHDDGSYTSAEEVAAAYGEVSDGGNSTQNVTNHWAEMFQVETPADMHLVVEFQCLHRLPETMALVFTIHKYIDPLSALAQTPEAADMMTRSWAAKSEEQMEYALGADPEKRAAVVDYVRSAAAVLHTGPSSSAEVAKL